MRLFASSLILFVIAYLGLASRTDAPPETGYAPARADTTLAARIGLGAELFSRTCQRCHNPRGPAERTDREWVIIMQHMQTRANLTREQARLVRDFLLASNDADLVPGRLRSDLETPTEVTDDLIAKGRLVYQGAGTCFACHGANLEGGPIAPSLSDDQWKNGTGDYASILETIRNGVPGTAMAAYPGGITDEQAQEVAAYVWAVSHGRADH
ncbi:c-type cytochrome [Rhodocaloribacter sp.]